MRHVLGAGEYGVTLSEWSGRVVWRSTDTALGGLTWSRERCQMSKASLEARVPVAISETVEPWVHLLTVYRDEAVVWHGVVTRVAVRGQAMTVEASDGSVMFTRRRIPINRWWAQHDASQVMSTMVEDACAYQDACGVVEHMVTLESRLWVTASYTAGESMLSTVVDDLEKQGLVWTIAAGRLLVGPIGATHTTAQLTDQFLDGEMTIIKDGAECVTDMLVTGAGVWGQWGKQDTPVGLLQGISKADGAAREAECEQQARRMVEESCVPPRRIEVSGGARLLPEAPVMIGELVPGVRVPVSSVQAGVLVGAEMQLMKVSVSVDSGGEKVSVSLGEAGTADSPAELPDPALLDWRSPYEKEMSKRAPKATPREQDEEEKLGTPPV